MTNGPNPQGARTATMQALVAGASPDWEVRELDIPTPGPDQLLIRVNAAALNRADLHMLAGSDNPDTQTGNEFIAGLELAGEVDAVGSGVPGFSVGDRVMGATFGAFAQYALIDHRYASHIPDALAATEAAALPVGLSTAHDALVTQAGFTPGDRVLIVGATSSTGLIAVQLAKALGAGAVLATTTSDAKASRMHALGADVVINTKTESLIDKVTDATDGSGVEITLDHVGGQLFADLLPATRIGGTILNIGRLAGPTSTINLDQLSFRRLRIQGTTFSVRTAEERAAAFAALVPEALPAVADGRIRPIIDRIFPFDQAHAAAERMRSNEALGKLILALP